MTLSLRTSIIVLLCFVHLNVSAIVYSIELKDSNNLSQDALERYHNIISQPEVIWNGVADIRYIIIF